MRALLRVQPLRTLLHRTPTARPLLTLASRNMSLETQLAETQDDAPARKRPRLGQDASFVPADAGSFILLEESQDATETQDAMDIQEKIHVSIEESATSTPSRAKRTTRTTTTSSAGTRTVETEETVVEQDPNGTKTTRKTRVKTTATTTGAADAKPAKKAVGKGKSKVFEAATLADFEPRAHCAWKLGAHISAAGGVEHAPRNAAAIGANAFALFLKSQRKWVSPPYAAENVATFKQQLAALGYTPDHVLPHGSYLLNLGNPDAEKREKSYDCFLDDLKRCEQLGLKLYNFHPGSTVGACTKAESIALIADGLNSAHKATSTVVTVLENMTGQGNIIGSAFEDLRDIIARVEDKDRVGVCLDTCHLFAAGHDIRSKTAYDKTMAAFDEIVGFKYLRGMHLNDSKGGFHSKKDRHENVGLGALGVVTFEHIVRDPRMRDIPLVLETPNADDPAVWAAELRVLHALAAAGDDGTDKARMEEMRMEVKAAFDGAEAAGKKGKGKEKKVAGKKRARKADDDDDGDDDVDDDE